MLSLVICTQVALPLWRTCSKWKYLRWQNPISDLEHLVHSLRTSNSPSPSPSTSSIDLTTLRADGAHLLLILDVSRHPSSNSNPYSHSADDQCRVSQRLFDDLGVGKNPENRFHDPYSFLAEHLHLQESRRGVSSNHPSFSEYAAVRLLGLRLFNCFTPWYKRTNNEKSCLIYPLGSLVIDTPLKTTQPTSDADETGLQRLPYSRQGSAPRAERLRLKQKFSSPVLVFYLARHDRSRQELAVTKSRREAAKGVSPLPPIRYVP